MRRREEKRRKLHEALLQTLYPPSSPSSPSSSPPPEFPDEDSFDVTLINPEDYVKIDSSNHGDDDNEIGDESKIAEKPSRAQRKRLRKKMLKEEAARRKTMIGPLLPTEMFQIPDGKVADLNRSNVEDEEEEESCLQLVRQNAQEKKEKFSSNDKTRKAKKRREAKKLAKDKESSKPIHLQDPTSETS